MDGDVKDQIKALLEAQIIQALNKAPEAIEKMVKAALADPVDSRTGNRDGYSGSRVPYLEWMVGEEIRQAARQAARTVIQERLPDIEAMVRTGLSSKSVVAAVTNALVGAASQEWKIDVTFQPEKPR